MSDVYIYIYISLTDLVQAFVVRTPAYPLYAANDTPHPDVSTVRVATTVPIENPRIQDNCLAVLYILSTSAKFWNDNLSKTGKQATLGGRFSRTRVSQSDGAKVYLLAFQNLQYQVIKFQLIYSNSRAV